MIVNAPRARTARKLFAAVARFATLEEAAMLAGRLAAQGVEARCWDHRGLEPILPRIGVLALNTGGVEVLVRASRLGEALRICRALEVSILINEG